MTVARRTALLGGLAAALAGCSGPGYRGPQRSLTIAAGERGGFYLAFAELLAAELDRAEPRLHCAAVSTEASVDNIGLVRDGEADLALTLADAVEAAVTGAAPFPGRVPLRAIGRVYENYLQFVARADGPVRTVGDLAGRRVSLGAAGSGAALTGDRLLAAAGLSARTGHLPLAEAVAALRERRIDALLWSGGVPTPALAELNRRAGLVLLPLDGVLPALRAAHGPVYQEVRVPADAYAGVPAVPTIGVANLLVSAPSLPDDVAAAVTRVLGTRAANLVPEQAVGAQYLDVRTLIGTRSVPLHPGAAAAYRALHG
ncbi:TAXI family TRAP transporter solute-binding subunit [Qaidamihabitans albus]|uniref:TAXI family TRAP transporter solute-binding subunit n=1 Tax=Qaidamihabitans albus TaxID=2795733 RepID=UPI0018F1BB47|nr:TAXI family TRAP transporter solute-binding subunit [Qaidamihabitans albus]